MRPKDKLQESVSLAREMGFEVLCASPIEIELCDSPDFDVFLGRLEAGKVDLVMFNSATAVQSCVELARRRGRIGRLKEGLHGTHIVAIGPVTARKLEQEGIDAEGMPEEFTSKGLVDYAKERGLAGMECYVLRSDHGAGELLPRLREAGLQAHELVVYSLQQHGEARDVAEIIEAGERGEVDAFLFTSSLSARTLIESWIARVGVDGVVEALRSRKVAAIGPPTKGVLESYGIRVDIMPMRATFKDMLEAIKAS